MPRNTETHREFLQYLAFAWSVDDVSDHPPREVATIHFQCVGANLHNTELVGQWCNDLAEPSGDKGDPIPETIQGSTKGPRSRCQADLLPDRVENRFRQAFEKCHALVQRLGEVDLARHRLGGDGCHLVVAARLRREEVDNFVLNNRRVHVENDQILASGVQVSFLNRNIHRQAGR